nr:PssD/Cps14F family polysaccharide biosynthesis glycosyltransferase [Erysipelotrichaceae bacterium]
MKKLLLISSEGGHLSELLQLEDTFTDYDYHLVTEKTPTTSFLKNTYPHKVTYLPYGTQDHLLPYLLIFPYNILKSLFIFLIKRPDVVITTGTHTAVPMCYIAHFFKKRVIYIETFASVKKPSKAGKLVYKMADLFVVQWEELLAIYPDAVYWGWIY